MSEFDSDSEDSLFSSSSSSSSEEENDNDNDDNDDIQYAERRERRARRKEKKKSKSSSLKPSSSEDREAFIRRKLLESFYGPDHAINNTTSKSNNNSKTGTDGGNNNKQTKIGTHSNSNSNSNSNTNSNNNNPDSPSHSNSHLHPKHDNLPPNSPSKTNLDSPSFLPSLYTESLIESSSTQTLLSSSISLQQSIRQYDSTMQTLVYENYSKFIDATDAIRSIGLSVSQSEHKLQNLQQRISNIQSNMTNMEHQIQKQRIQVTEKTRVKKLLNRLTRLLELPKTLFTLKQMKKYRNAMNDYLDAMVILNKHSDGFESLKNIEFDCCQIMITMIQELGQFVWVWMGNQQGKISTGVGSNTTAIATTATNTDVTTNTSISTIQPVGVGGSARTMRRHTTIVGRSEALDLFIRNGRVLFHYSHNNNSNSNKSKSATTIFQKKENTTIVGEDEDDDEYDYEYDQEKVSRSTSPSDVTPPQSITEIFECIGALLSYADHREEQSTTTSTATTTATATATITTTTEDNEAFALLLILKRREYQIIALECCTRYLQSILEDHVMDIQEEKLKHLSMSQTQEQTKQSSLSSASTSKVGQPQQQRESKQETSNSKSATISSSSSSSRLYPRKYLDAMLEAATLFGVTFHSTAIYNKNTIKKNSHGRKHNTNNSNSKEKDGLYSLNEFIATWFTSFLSHVRMILLESSNHQNSSNSHQQHHYQKHNDMHNVDDDDDDEENDVAFADMSHELMNLLRNVREVASGLALPEVGLDMEVASSLVEQTVGITESMVKRRVSQKFKLLRVRVLKECLVPFVKDVLNGNGSNGSGSIGSGSGGGGEEDVDSFNVIKIVQSASIALSDGMQMVDDTIRSILSREGSAIAISSGPLDSEMVKVAVRKNARKFSFWLAAALENISGCDTASDEVTLDVKYMKKDDDNDDEILHQKQIIKAAAVDLNGKFSDDETKEDNNDDDDDDDDNNHVSNYKERAMLANLCDYVQDNMCTASNNVLNLSIVEMCRLAARNVSNNMNQSILSSIGEGSTVKQSKKDVFHKPNQQVPSNIDSDGLVSTRFQLAAARALSLYATMKGYEAASAICLDVWESCAIQSEFFPHGPTELSWRILEVAKGTSIDCAAAFGGDVRAAPMPSFHDDMDDYMPTGTISGSGGGRYGGAIKGLSLDVARMFTQKVQVYPHPLELMDFSRNAVVTLLLKVAFKAWIEQIRLCRLSAFAYRQLQVDVEFLKIMLSHYVEEESINFEALQTLLSDLVLNAGERCEDVECVGVTEYYDEARGKVLSPGSIAIGFLKEEEVAGKRGVLGQFLIQSNSEENEESNGGDGYNESLE